MFRKILVLAVAVMAISAVTALACGNDASRSTDNTSTMINTTAAPAQVSLKGVLTCSSCALKAEGAQSACSEFGCSHALKTSDGRFINLMQNKFSKNLLSDKKNHNRPVEITGTFFANANVLDVKSYTIGDGKTLSWCDHCKGMDACMAGKGDSH